MQHPILKALEEATRSMDGMYRIGACAALRAMIPFWEVHFREGAQAQIIIDDVTEAIEEIQEILRGVMRHHQTAFGASSQPDDLSSELIRLGLNLYNTGGHWMVWRLDRGSHHLLLTDAEGSANEPLSSGEPLVLCFYKGDESKECQPLIRGTWKDIKPRIDAFLSGEWLARHLRSLDVIRELSEMKKLGAQVPESAFYMARDVEQHAEFDHMSVTNFASLLVATADLAD